jgi:hypothetical protein
MFILSISNHTFYVAQDPLTNRARSQHTFYVAQDPLSLNRGRSQHLF